VTSILKHNKGWRFKKTSKLFYYHYNFKENWIRKREFLSMPYIRGAFWLNDLELTCTNDDSWFPAWFENVPSGSMKNVKRSLHAQCLKFAYLISDLEKVQHLSYSHYYTALLWSTWFWLVNCNIILQYPLSSLTNLYILANWKYWHYFLASHTLDSLSLFLTNASGIILRLFIHINARLILVINRSLNGLILITVVCLVVRLIVLCIYCIFS